MKDTQKAIPLCDHKQTIAELQSQLEECKKENEILRSKETQFKSTLEATMKERDEAVKLCDFMRGGQWNEVPILKDQLTEAVKLLERAEDLIDHAIDGAMSDFDAADWLSEYRGTPAKIKAEK